MSLSNDIQWNKIKAIEKELPLDILDEESYLMWHGTRKGYNYNHFYKIAIKERWVLANKLYDIATEGSKPADNPYSYGSTALTKEKVIYYVNQLPLHIYADDLSYCMNSRDFYWEMYEYSNN